MSDPQVCAFCGRVKHQVKNLIAGDALAATVGSVGICENCVGQSFDILVESGALAPRRAPAPASAPAAPMDAAGAIRAAVRAMPRSVDVRALHDLATAGIELAAGNAAALRILAYDLGNAMAFEEALRVRAGIAAFERSVSDSLADAAYLTRIGNAQEGLAVLDRLARGPLSTKATAGESAGASLSRMYAQLALSPWDHDVRTVQAELETLATRLATIGLEATYLRALENQVVHIRARAAMAMRRDVDAIHVLTQQLAVRELDIEALALLVEVYERTGDRASAARARDKAMAHIPKNSAYAKRIAAR